MFDFSSMIYTVPALLIAITIHEYAHALAADAMGDPTPRYLGRLTFNPLAHLDILGAIMLALFHFGWAKPVAINPNNFRNRREGMIKVSLAGPAANLFLCFLAALIMVSMQRMHVLTPGVSAFLLWTMQYNVWFAFFNLLPIPPLDGSSIFALLIPAKYLPRYYRIQQYAFPVFMIAVVLLPYLIHVNPFSWYLGATAGNLGNLLFPFRVY